MVDSTAEELARLRQRVEQLEGRRRSPATLVAMLALIVALSGGTAWAAATVGTDDIMKKAVTTPKLDTEAVTTAKLGPQAVTPAKIAPGAVRTGKIFDAAVTEGKLADNAVTTAKLQDGQVLAPDLGVITERRKSGTIAAGASAGVQANCNAGERVISGGHGAGVNVVNISSYKSFNGWWAGFTNNTAGTREVFAAVYCLAAP
jgi:hypothetical protein